MKCVYVDSPYLGCCGLYNHHHPPGERPFDGRCWDDPETHRLLIDWVCAEFPDGFALNASSPSLRTILPMTPLDVRVGAWVKTFCAFKRGVRPAYAWEPVLFRSIANPPHVRHPPPVKGGAQTTPKDFIAAPITLKRGFTGAKPAVVARWIFHLLNLRPATDTLIDLFPGSGSVTAAWQEMRP